MKKVFISFLLACSALVASAQINETPIKTFDYGADFVVFTYENGDQVFIDTKDGYENLFIYDLSFVLKKTVDFSVISGFEYCSGFYDRVNNIHIYVTEKIFNDDNLLEFVLRTEDGFVVVNENGQEIFRKRYDDFESDCSLLETKNGNLLEVYLYSCEHSYDPEIGGSIYSCVEKTEIYALPGYSASNIKSANIQQLGNPFPNPAKTYIHLPYTLPEGVNEATVRVFDAQGKIIKMLRADKRSEYVRLDTTNLPAGSYFFSLDVRGQKGESRQFIVK